MENKFIRVRSIKDIVIFLSLIIIGSVVIALPTGAGVNIAALFIIFSGIILALVLKTGYRNTETGQRYMKKEHYFQQAMNPIISSAIQSKPESIDMSQADMGNSLKLDVYYSKQTGKAYLQLFEYVPYKYEACSKMYEYPIEKINKLLR